MTRQQARKKDLALEAGGKTRSQLESHVLYRIVSYLTYHAL